MHWVSKVVGATVGAAERIADIQHEWHIARKTTTNRAGFKQVFNLQHAMRKRLSGTETGCVRVQSRRYQSYTWKEGVEGGMGTKEASWERIGGAWQYILPL